MKEIFFQVLEKLKMLLKITNKCTINILKKIMMIIKQKEKVELHGRRDFIYPSEQIRIAIRNKSGFQGWEGDISKLSTFCNCGHQYAYFQTEEFQFMNDI